MGRRARKKKMQKAPQAHTPRAGGAGTEPGCRVPGRASVGARAGTGTHLRAGRWREKNGNEAEECARSSAALAHQKNAAVRALFFCARTPTRAHTHNQLGPTVSAVSHAPRPHDDRRILQRPPGRAGGHGERGRGKRGARAANSFLQSRAGALTHLPHPHPPPSPLFRPTASSAWARPARPGRKPGAGGPSRWTPKVREEEGGRAQRGAGALASLFFFDLRARPPALSLTPRPPPTLPTLQTSPPSSGRPPPGAATSP